MEKRYKLLKDLPDVKVGAIFELVGGGYQPHKYINYETEQYYNPDVLKNNPNWFAPYLFTTDDGVEIFGNDNYLDVYYEVTLSNKISKIGNYRYERKVSNTYFSTKEAAKEYLDSFKPKFKIADIVTFESLGLLVTGVVCGIDPIANTLSVDGRSVYISECKLATEEEIVAYYEKQGWVKGAKFKYSHTYDKVLTIKNIFIRNGRVCIHHLEPNVTGLCNSDSSVLFIEDCKLVKEADYPKSWEDLKLKNSIKGFIGEEGSQECTFFQEYTPSDFHYEGQGRMLFSTIKQAKSALAFAQLTQLHAATIAEYNRVNGVDWKPDYTDENIKWTITRNFNYLGIDVFRSSYIPFAFPTKELAQHALDNWKELWEQYYELT